VSHLNRAFGLGAVLRGRGHRVTFVSACRGAEALVRDNGFDFRALATPRQFIRPLGGLRERRHLVSREAATARRILASTEFGTLLAECRPDLLLIDYELHTQIIRAIAAGRRMMLLEYECSPRRTGMVPVPSSNLLPTGSPWNRLLVAGSWWAESCRRRLRFALSAVYYGGHDRWSTIRRLAARHGIDLRQHATRRHWQFLAYPALPTLYLSPWEFDFPNRIANREFYVGPMLRASRREPGVDPEYAPLIQRLEAGRDAGRRPLVYCAMGSILSDEDYFRRVIEAVGSHPEWDVIIATGRGTSGGGLGRTPEHVHVLGFVPQLDMLGRADLMLTHAGSGSVFECILQGVPMLCYSGGAKEENGNAARVAYHGLGLRGDPARDGPAVIAAHIERLLSDPGFRSRVTAFRERLRHYAETDRVAALLESAVDAAPGDLGWRTLR
jgi:UDP:flavonoid glycosyltransferase YjiC (YdhE family)